MVPAAAVPAPDAILLQAVLDVSLTGLILLRPLYASHDPETISDLAYVQLNLAAQRMLQLPECPAETFLTLYPHAAQTGIFDFHCATFRSGEPGRYDVNYQADRLDNYFQLASRRVGELLLVSFSDTAEQPRSAVEVALRESQAAEKAARAEAEIQRQRFYDVLMQLPAHVALHEGPDQVFTLVNPDYRRIANGRDLLGQPIREAWPELISHGILDVLDQVYQTGEPFIANEMPVQADFTRTGQLEQVYYNFFFLALRNAQGIINGVLNFSYDVTEQVRARQQVERLNQQLEARVQQRTGELTASNRQLTRTNVDLDTFIYTASHDLQTPVANIEGLLLALREELPAEVRRAGVVQPLLDRMQGAVERFQLTIAQLTDVARLQQAQVQPAEAVDLGLLVENLRLDLAPLLATTGTQLTLDVAACPQVSFAPQHLRSIVYNLLSNAVKYRHPDRPPHVQLRCRSTDALVVLEVEDNGLGLTPDQQGQLFGLFRRLHDHVEGSGLGLYITKRLVENAGGTIRVQSQAGAGSTFTVTLPRAGPSGEAPAE